MMWLFLTVQMMIPIADICAVPLKEHQPEAQIVYERKDGTIDERRRNYRFDINQDVIELTDADYAIWYMDAMENYKIRSQESKISGSGI